MEQRNDFSVVCAYHGVGKTHFADKYKDNDTKVVEILYNDYQHNGEWLADVQDAMAEGSLVITDHYLQVREILQDQGINYLLIYPDETCLNEYIERWKDNDTTDSMIENYSALFDGEIEDCRMDRHAALNLAIPADWYLTDVLGTGE